MVPFRVRSFQRRIFVAILAVVLVPAGITVAGGTLVLSRIGSTSGTLGAWDAVARSGRDLLDALSESQVTDPEVRRSAEEHREALSSSVRFSRTYAFLAQRFLRVLPLAALATGALVTGLALLTARLLSRGFSRPIEELVGWAERIAHDEPLPPRGERDDGLREFEVLRTALRDMAAEIEEGRRRAVESARLRSWTDLARRVAHEIKNPLTPMRMAALTLSRGAEGPRAEAGRILLEEIERLDQMARTFSQYGRMPEGPPSPVDLEELARSLARQHGTDDLTVRVESTRPGVTVTAHLDALERALRNLVVNAVEAQEAMGGEVRISISEEDGHATVAVEDRGPGIPEDVLDRIWDPDVTTKQHGTGLGLAMVRQTVALHGGSVSASNLRGGGARFVVRLPMEEPAGNRGGARRGQGASPGSERTR